LTRLQYSRYTVPVCPRAYWHFFLDCAWRGPQIKSWQPLRVQNHVPLGIHGFAPAFLLPKSRKDENHAYKPQTLTQTDAGHGHGPCIEHKPIRRPNNHPASARGNQLSGADMVSARPSPRIVTPRGACSPASVAHSRTWEHPAAIWPRVNRRENPPTLMGVCGVITHQSQFHKQRQFYQAAEAQRFHAAAPLRLRRNPVETVSFADG